jgi:hypothetical protein
MAGDKILYVSNYDPSGLLPTIRETICLHCDVANNRYDVEEALKRAEQYRGALMTDLALGPGKLRPGEIWTSNLTEAYQIGLDVARQIKKSGLPLLVLSCNADKFFKELREMGVDHILKKPCAYEQYLVAAREMFMVE